LKRAGASGLLIHQVLAHRRGYYGDFDPRLDSDDSSISPEALRTPPVVPDDPMALQNAMSVHRRPPTQLTSRPIVRRGLYLWIVGAAILLALVAACGFPSESATLTAASTPTPAPRPTAEPLSAVSGWYVAAQSEEPVRIRADLTDAEADALTSAFARRFPHVAIEWRRGADAELLQQTLGEARSARPDWDIYIGDSGASLKTARLALYWIPPEAGGLPPTLVDPEGAWYGLAATLHVIQYHSEQVPPAFVPPSYDALRHPGYFGRLAIEDLNLTWLKGLIEIRGLDAAADLVRGLAQQAVTFRRDARSLVVFVTAGHQAVGIDARLDVVERERRGGGKTAWTGSDPVIGQPLAMVVSAATDRPNGARLVANYLLSTDAQIILAEGGRVPGRADLDPALHSQARGLRPLIVLPPEGQAERELRELWQQLWGRR
jgi:iron(III) transport system substrate-binding protein